MQKRILWAAALAAVSTFSHLSPAVAQGLTPEQLAGADEALADITYGAETRAWMEIASWWPETAGLYRSTAKMQAAVDLILDSAWWQSHAPSITHVHVRPRKDLATDVLAFAARTGSHQGVILVRADGEGWKVPMLLHELAHIASGPTRSGLGHDPDFHRTYTSLVRATLGPEAADTLAYYLDRQLDAEHQSTVNWLRRRCSGGEQRACTLLNRAQTGG